MLRVIEKCCNSVTQRVASQILRWDGGAVPLTRHRFVFLHRQAHLCVVSGNWLWAFSLDSRGIHGEKNDLGAVRDGSAVRNLGLHEIQASEVGHCTCIISAAATRGHKRCRQTGTLAFDDECYRNDGGGSGGNGQRRSSGNRSAKFNFDSGQAVQAGDILVELDTRQERAQLAALEAQRDLAKINYARMQQLVNEGVISQGRVRPRPLRSNRGDRSECRRDSGHDSAKDNPRAVFWRARYPQSQSRDSTLPEAIRSFSCKR